MLYCIVLYYTSTVRYFVRKLKYFESRDFAETSHGNLKLTLGNMQRYTPIRIYPTAPLYNIIIYDTILRQERHFKHEK